MAKIVLDMSMSLDGFIAGPNDSTEHPLGVGGHRLHEWLNDGSGDPPTFRPTAEPSVTVFDEMMATGAVIAGRHTYDLAGGWDGDHHDVERRCGGGDGECADRPQQAVRAHPAGKERHGLAIR